MKQKQQLQKKKQPGSLLSIIVKQVWIAWKCESVQGMKLIHNDDN